jgi:3-oxoacyl-[acyl-carrier protein] reductase
VEQGNLIDTIAIATGGNNGIGAATVRMLALAGAIIYVGYNRGGVERAAKLIAELPGSGHKAVNLVLENSAPMRSFRSLKRAIQLSSSVTG